MPSSCGDADRVAHGLGGLRRRVATAEPADADRADERGRQVQRRDAGGSTADAPEERTRRPSRPRDDLGGRQLRRHDVDRGHDLSGHRLRHKGVRGQGVGRTAGVDTGSTAACFDTVAGFPAAAFAAAAFARAADEPAVVPPSGRAACEAATGDEEPSTVVRGGTGALRLPLPLRRNREEGLLSDGSASRSAGRVEGGAGTRDGLRSLDEEVVLGERTHAPDFRWTALESGPPGRGAVPM